MTLRERISSDLKAAMKTGDKIRLETLRTLRAALVEKEIEKRGSQSQGITADDEIATLINAAKKRRESIGQFAKGGRPELAEQEARELSIIQEYLPKQLSTDEISRVIEDVVRESGMGAATDFGKVMPAVMRQLKGKADGQMIQELVKKRLGLA
ncbi:MAG: GatB/YqeY domain-containing protein [Ignavibacteriae bacterium]|nr:GatB/YqeY domain-containing protein [Ignavibacteriota bacterium]